MNRMRALAKAAESSSQKMRKHDAEEAKRRGNEFFKAGKLDEAIECYSKAIDTDPENHVYVSNRAAAHLKKDEYAAALADCEKVLDVVNDLSDDQTVKCLYRKGLALAGLGKHAAACDALEEAIR